MKEIKLTKGMVALVDDEDFEHLSKWKWTASHGSRSRKWYAIRRETIGPPLNGQRQQKRVAMHRQIMGGNAFLGDLVVDHLNDDSLDNRKENLRIVTQEENMRRVPGWTRKMEKPEL